MLGGIVGSSSPTPRSATERRGGSAAHHDHFSGVAANFGGVPLAFAFIATIGPLGIITVFLRNTSASTYAHGSRSSRTTGVELVYLYFQFPLMILVIAPAIDGLRREWREAASTSAPAPGSSGATSACRC